MDKNTLITDLELISKAESLCAKLGVITVADLLEKNRNELMSVKGFGRKTVKFIEEELARYGYEIK